MRLRRVGLSCPALQLSSGSAYWGFSVHASPLLLAGGMLVCALALAVPWPSYAADTRLLDVGLRAGFSGSSPIGEQTRQHFQQYDAMAMFGLPWEWYSESGWGIGTRLLVSGGALRTTGETGFISTFVPGIAFGDKQGRISLESGGGAALLSDHTFGTQKLGGPFQFVWNIGLRAAVYRGFRVGYWFEHLSDATIYGLDSRGFDLHMVELSYRY